MVVAMERNIIGCGTYPSREGEAGLLDVQDGAPQENGPGQQQWGSNRVVLLSYVVTGKQLHMVSTV